MPKNNKKITVRNYVLWITFVFSVVLFALLIRGNLKVAHAFCPYSAVCFGVMSLNPAFGKFLFPAAIIGGLAILIYTIFFGRKFCGYVCPLGTAQELIYQLNPKSRKNSPPIVPKALHTFLSKFKYLILLITVISAFFAFQFGYMKFCPVLAIAHPQRIQIAGIITLTIIFGGGFFIERFWCRYLCPYAALMNIVQKIGNLLRLPRSRIHRNMEVCIDCYLCTKSCPMQIGIHQQEIIEDLSCIHCLRCVEKCPKTGGLKFKIVKI